MKDQLERSIEYVRLSVTERCNLRCIYCRGEEPWHSGTEEMTADEIERIIDSMARLGINKVRLTGGEPLIRQDIEEIIRRIAKNKDIKDICMTTNGCNLLGRTQKLKEAGLNRLNISLDSLDEKRYAKVTRGGDIKKVLAGIKEAVANELLPLKINVVVIPGQNDDEIDDFIALTKHYPIDVRFIELMPIGSFGEKQTKVIKNSEIIGQRPYLIKIDSRYIGQPAEEYKVPGHAGRVGFISPMSHKFCHLCNRIRVTSNGNLKLCLGSNEEIPLLPAMQKGDRFLEETIKKGIAEKPKGHKLGEGFLSSRIMSQIGG